MTATSKTLETLVADLLREPLAAARAHRQAGGRVIGYVGAEVPVELIIAAGAYPLCLPSFADRATPAAGQYLESSFAPAVSSITEQYLQGELDFLDAIILPRSNDSAQRVYYYLCELQRTGLKRGPALLIYDLAKIPRDTSSSHSQQATQQLAGQLAVDMAALPAAIAQRNRRRRLIADLMQLRHSTASVSGTFAEQLSRAADLCSADQFDSALQVWLAQPHDGMLGPRLLLAGSAPPDERLHRAVESAGGNVVAELGEHRSCVVALPVVAANGGYAALAQHYQQLTCGPRAFVDRAAQLLDAARAARVDGVILWLIEQEEALIWDLPAQRDALQAAGVPLLSLVRRSWNADDGALDDITKFVHNLRGNR